MAERVDVIVIGAGASGLMCAARAGKKGRRVVVLDHGPKAGQKILMSGGGRCNFTNKEVTADHFISSNPHFCKSAISRYTPYDFLDLVTAYGISYEERRHGQLFCTGSASEILEMLMMECRKANVKITLNRAVKKIEHLVATKGSVKQSIKRPSKTEIADPGSGARFRIHTPSGQIDTQSLVIATGGLSIPGVGASPFGYQVAEQFDIPIVPVRPGLVPLTLQPEDKKMLESLAGISVDATVCVGSTRFTEKLLFTHRGLSGPVILQISSYWKPGQPVTIDLLPFHNVQDIIAKTKEKHPKKYLKSTLYKYLPKRLVDLRFDVCPENRSILSLSKDQLERVSTAFHRWELKPGGTEGNRTAEVTVGGVDCNHISSKTMETRTVPGLFFIGEVLDVTGWLGGYNLQWAWASGYCAGGRV